MAAIAPWFCLPLPSCGPGFESQADHLRFFQFVLLKLHQENKQKEAGIGQFFKNLQSKFVSSVLTIYLLAYLLSIRRYGVRSCCIDRQSDSL